MRTRIVLVSATMAVLSACVTQVVPQRRASFAPRFNWLDAAPVLLSGTYHGVNLLLEIDPKTDVSADRREALEEALAAGTIYARVAPEYKEHREVYRFPPVHEFEYFNGMFHVGEARYYPKRQASLHVFKKRQSAFRFAFRGQTIEVLSARPWIPSILYSKETYSPQAPSAPDVVDGRRQASALRFTREVVQIGRDTIETDPERDRWLVNGGPYQPGGKKPLVLRKN